MPPAQGVERHARAATVGIAVDPTIPELSRAEAETAERTFELIPAPRVVGPGRRERAYLERIAELDAAVRARESELAAAGLVERGSTRRLDRMERKLDAVREAAVAVEQREKRLILALGALQRENELLRERTRELESGSASSRARALPAPAGAREPRMKRSLLARLFRRSS